MKRSIRAVVVGLTVACACVGAAGMAFAQDIKERNIKFAFANTADSAHGIGAKRFAEMVASKSGGKLNVKLYGSGTLGGEAVVASAMQGGTIEMSMMGPGLLTGMDKEFGVFDTPFLFDSFKEVDAALDGPVGKKLLDKLPAKGLVGLSYWDHGFRILTNSKRPIAKLEDIQGLKIRVQQIPVFIESFNAMGANAVPMPFPELYSALEQKAVDGQENPFISVEVTKFYEVQKYASTTRHAYSPLLVLMSKKFWDQLSADERKVLTDAANEVKSYERQVSRELDAKALDTLKSRGMVITEVSAQERARMRDKLKPVIDKHRQTTGELGKEMTAEVERIRSGK
ncbi:tripartite ATP-independent transporter solute receptor, DctP family [Variovorax sp. CF079]|uniref:TRAP transporter substrate-binding protein n=1 Tax=Variovorax sp. CF079 TaxID=1882774 RepID=UPI0008877F92|nr:TRAP transporter substrate-binding protein [Variovorax sp. CF079]SDD37788.1 tripartite ATP-independent transporter solute receptor, DctP family [Variovorax sp. CF079]